MKIASIYYFLFFLLIPLTINAQINTLSKQEIKEGWKLLFNGENFEGWRGTYIDHFPESGWTIEQGVLKTLPAYGDERKKRGGSIITEEQFGDFELYLEFSYEAGVNSGIKYYVLEFEPPNPKHGLGLEYQIWDDQQDRDANKKMACLYDLIIAKNTSLKPIGEFNSARIISQGGHVEHWLNEQKVLEYERGSTTFRDLVAKSKYKNIPLFGEANQGHILLQDEGGPSISYRNIKIRML